MVVHTLIVGYVPLADTSGKKPAQIRNDTYFNELLANFDLGELHYANYDNWRSLCDEVNPLFIIVFGDHTAEEVKAHKNDALIYKTYDAGQIFYRKAEIEEKKATQRKTFTEIAALVQKMREGDEKEVEGARKFAAMSYNDMYKMIIQAIIGKSDDLRQKAWDLLNDNNAHSNFIWMRAQLLAEVWDHCDGKGKEEFLCMAMDQHVENGSARKLVNHTDEDGQEWHQYMFVHFNGADSNYIRRIPVGFKGQEKYSYQAILDKYETPNGVRVMLEAGQIKKMMEEYYQNEAAKIVRVLTMWKEDSTRSKKELGVAPWVETDSNEDPLTEQELASMKRFLEKHDKLALDSVLGSV